MQNKNNNMIKRFMEEKKQNNYDSKLRLKTKQKSTKQQRVLDREVSFFFSIENGNCCVYENKKTTPSNRSNTVRR